ncbi:hypothetical protein BYT27DRAFT_7298997 [Phlegmacium glaucopus]|nr:hypothetical protein BYT27DRAFT_7298997 [Phlegmacium glaucopus]
MAFVAAHVDKPALDATGHLKDASEMDFYNSESDDVPLPHKNPSTTCVSANNLDVLLDAEKHNSDGEIELKAATSRKPRKNKKKLNHGDSEEDTDKDDHNFLNTSLASESSSDEFSIGEENPEIITNMELASTLPSKSVPTTGCGSGKRKRGVEVVEIEDDNSPFRVSECNTPPIGNSIIEDAQVTESNAPHTKWSKSEAVKKNPIHYFYEQVDCGANGVVGNPGDKHFKCYHGNHKVLTLTKSMKYNLTTLVTHLKQNFPLMFKLFSVLKDRSSDQQATAEELDIASGKKILDPEKAKAWFTNFEAALQNIHQAFQKQAEVAAVSLFFLKKDLY